MRTVTEPSPKPNPGSQAAIDAGCICPRMDNAYGKRPADYGRWVIVLGCPVHMPVVPQ